MFIIFITVVIISSSIILMKENKFKNAYIDVSNINATAIVKSPIKEKEYGNQFEVEILESNNFRKIENTKLIVTDMTKYTLEYGDIIELSGEYEDITSYKNRGTYNYKQALKSKNIYGKLQAKNINKIRNKKTFYKYFVELNRCIKEKFEKNFSDKTSSILKALVIGNKDNLDGNVREKIQDNGLSHVLAISGMHIGCIILILQKLLDKLTYDNKLKKIVIVIVLIIFGLIIGFITSAMRAIIMAVLAIASKLFYKKDNFLVNISIASLIILIYNPYYLFDAGTILSFSATIGIVYVFPKINKLKIKNKIVKYLIEFFLLSISVNIFIIPITIYFFKRISISYFITGIIITPLIFIIETFGLFMVFLPEFILKFLSPIIEMFVQIFINLSQIDFGFHYFKVPTILEIILYYLILVYILNSKMRKIFKKIIKSVIITCLIISIIITMEFYFRDDLIVYFIDVGQGDSTVIRTKENVNILVDGGGLDDYNIGKNVVIPYLLTKKIDTIDYMLVSHFDTDHVKGCIEVLKYLKVKNVIISAQSKESSNLYELLDIVGHQNINLIICKKGDEIQTSKTTKFQILWPQEKQINEDLNNNSIVAKFIYKNTSILFTGDIESKAEKEIAKDKEILESDILKVAHHGSKTSTNQEILQYIKPHISIIGVGLNNTFGHPSPNTLNNLQSIGSKIYRTDLNGEIIIKVNGNGKIKVQKYID